MATRDDYIDTVKSGLIIVGTNSVMSGLALIPGVGPILALPVVSTVVKIFVNKIVSIMINSGEMGAFFGYIDLRVSAQGRTWLETAKKNKEAQLGKDKEAIAQAEKDFMLAHRNFVILSR